MQPRWSLRARVSLTCLALFWLFMLGAMWSYAGGSWLHPSADSHVFLENFWCDLLRDPAHNGQPNRRSVALGMLGFVAIAGALGGFWLELSRVFPAGRARFLRYAGTISAVATAAVAVMPSDRFPALHPPAVLTAGGLGFACGCLCSAWAIRHFREAPVFALSSLLLVAAAALNLALYIRAIYFTASETIIMPAAQKVASIALVFWLVSGLSAARARASSPRPTQGNAANT